MPRATTTRTSLRGYSWAFPAHRVSYDPAIVPEAPLERTEYGLVPKGEGWFVLNAREARWRDRGPGGAYCGFEGEPHFEQLGINLVVLGPGQPIAMYHWEDDQEDFSCFTARRC